MAAEFDLQISAQHHQADLLAEAAPRRLFRTSSKNPAEPATVAARLGLVG